MSVRYEWADDSHFIMNIIVEFPWSWKEYIELTDTLMPVLREEQTPCATIVDTTKMGSMPRDGNALQILLNADKNIPDNVFASVIVGAPYSISVFMNMLTKLRPHARRIAVFADTIEDAHQKISERYKQLYPDTNT